jgi:uncharacterized protein YjiS (DUF1127 family)
MRTTALAPHELADDVSEANPRNPGSIGLLRRALDGIAKALEDRRTMRELSELDDAILRDIGVPESDIRRIRAYTHVRPCIWAE